VFAPAPCAAAVLAVVVCAVAGFTAAVFAGFETAGLRKMPKKAREKKISKVSSMVILQFTRYSI